MTEATLTSVFAEALRAARKEPAPEVEARFYPYAGLSSTIRLRQGRVYVRVSDVLAGSPPEVLYALACMLVAKLYRRKVSGEHERIYKQYTSRREVLDASESVRRQRGYKVITSPRGKVYDLEQAFDDLNARYFQAALVRPLLSWSPGRPRRILGHHDHVHATIIISRALDSAAIPRFVLEYVLYHEMLHVKHEPIVQGGRTVYHSRQFRADERRFERFDEALKWLEQIAPRIRRRRGPARRRFHRNGTN
jgi:predicted metal-dependent hydrolase